MSPNETSMFHGLNTTTTSLSKLADARHPPLLDPRRELSRKLWTHAMKIFPGSDLDKSPRKTFKIFGLHYLVEQKCDIIHLHLLHCKGTMCVEAFRLKDEDFIKDEVAAFI